MAREWQEESHSLISGLPTEPGCLLVSVYMHAIKNGGTQLNQSLKAKTSQAVPRGTVSKCLKDSEKTTGHNQTVCAKFRKGDQAFKAMKGRAVLCGTEAAYKRWDLT